MEFILNKIDPEVRERVNQITSAGKIHTKTGVVINKENKNKNKRELDSELEKKKGKKEKKIFSVDAVKVEEVEVSAYKEETGNEVTSYILDVKR